MAFRTRAFLLCAAVALSGCETTRLSPAIKAYGEVVSSSAGAIGDNASTLRRSLRHQQLAVWNANFPAGARQALVCTPISYAFDPTLSQATLSSVGERLGEVASESPDTFIGLAYALRDDYSAELEGREPGESLADAQRREHEKAEAARSRLDDACVQAMRDTFAQQADTIARLERLRPIGSTEGASLSGSLEVLSTIRGLFIRFGQMVDQSRRQAALERYFSTDEIMAELVAAQRELDLSIRITELGSRLAAQRRYVNAWEEYRQAVAERQIAATAYQAELRRDPTAPDRTPYLRSQVALNELIAASADLDSVVAGRSRDLAIERLTGEARNNNKRCINDPPPVRAPDAPLGTVRSVPENTCWYTAVGLNLHNATNRLRSAVLMDENMTDEDREALAIAIGAVIESIGELGTELEGLDS